MTITLLGCLLGGCVASALYVVCVWQALFWGGVFGLGKEVGSRPAPANAAERPA